MSAAVDLYNNPADMFVASFTGVTNTLRGHMVGRDGEFGDIELDRSAAHILAKVPDGLHVGEAVLVGLRPENITLSAPGSGETARQQFSGKIIRRRFHGGQSVYTVEVLSTQLDVVELGTTPRFAAGAEVVVRVPPELCWAFRGSEFDGAAPGYV